MSDHTPLSAQHRTNLQTVFSSQSVKRLRVSVASDLDCRRHRWVEEPVNDGLGHCFERLRVLIQSWLGSWQHVLTHHLTPLIHNKKRSCHQSLNV